MKKQDSDFDKVESAIAGGLIGAALGAMFTDSKESTLLATVIGAAIGATYKAYQESKNMGLGVAYLEDGVIYNVLPNNEREMIGKVKKNKVKVPQRFQIG